MGKTITLQGSLDIGGDPCGGCGPGGDRTLRGLSLRGCSSAFFQGAESTDIDIQITTPGLIGQNWTALPMTADFIGVEFLKVTSNQPVRLRIGAAPAIVAPTAGVYPTSFSGGETLVFTLDGVSVSVAFLIGDQSAAQVAARINAECALAGLATPVASVSTGGQLVLTGKLTGLQGSIVIVSGSALTRLGLAAGTTFGSGQDVDVYGTFMNEFPPYPIAPARIQISGVASISVVAAGRTSP